MYHVITTKETVPGFLYATITDSADFQPNEGFEQVGSQSFDSHGLAVKELMRLRSEYCKHNLKLDPNYLPPSKRIQQ